MVSVGEGNSIQMNKAVRRPDLRASTCAMFEAMNELPATPRAPTNEWMVPVLRRAARGVRCVLAAGVATRSDFSYGSGRQSLPHCDMARRVAIIASLQGTDPLSKWAPDSAGRVAPATNYGKSVRHEVQQSL